MLSVLLFHALGGAFPVSSLLQLQSPQLRWSEHGTERGVIAPDASLDQQLIDITCNENYLREIVNLFASTALIDET